MLAHFQANLCRQLVSDLWINNIWSISLSGLTHAMLSLRNYLVCALYLPMPTATITSTFTVYQNTCTPGEKLKSNNILKGCTFTTCLSYISDNGAYVTSVVVPVAVTVVAVPLVILAIVSSLMWLRWVSLLHGIDAYNLACILVMISSSYNTLPRAASKIQYKAKAKPRPCNYILPEAWGSGYN